MAKLSISNVYPDINLFINGGMQVAQRNTSQAASSGTSGNWIVDRWEFAESGAAVVTISQEVDAPTFAESGSQELYSGKIDVTTVDDSLGDTDYNCVLYQFEGQDILPYVGIPLTISFWLKATKTGTQTFGLKIPDGPYGYTWEDTITTTDTWEFFKHTFTIPAAYADPADIADDSTVGLRFYTALGLGADYQLDTTETWSDATGASFMGTSNQINHMDSTDNNFQLTNLKLQPGTIATPYVRRKFSDELALCQRYYEKSYAVDEDPGTITNEGRHIEYTTRNGSGNAAGYPWIVPKRTIPTVVIYNPISGAAGYLNNGGTTRVVVASNPSATGMSGMVITSGSTSYVTWHYTAEAEL